MPTLTLKNLPQDVYERLRTVAAAHRRSLNSEILFLLDRALGARRPSPEEIRQRAAELRARWSGPPLTMDEITDAKRLGRP